MLKAIVDETSPGRYDFMYLRIGKISWLHSSGICLLTLSAADFANNCKYVVVSDNKLGLSLHKFCLSVGYAFINFEDVS